MKNSVAGGSLAEESTAQRITREREFHNRVFADHSRQAAGKYYSVMRGSRRCYESVLNRYGRGSTVLEFGCGPGFFAPYLAARGASVTGIDISETAIAQARERAAEQGVSGNLTLEVMNAEALEFPAHSFDLVCGVAILHHLDLDRAYGEIARTLKPGGRAVFLEPLGHNPVINLYRRMTPGLRTEDEHPLLTRDLRLADRYFDEVRTHFFTLHSLLAVPFRNMAIFSGLLDACESADRLVFRTLPPARRLAWQVVIELARPRAARENAAAAMAAR
jgi:SAM-dependent methyltransferase